MSTNTLRERKQASRKRAAKFLQPASTLLSLKDPHRSELLSRFGTVPNKLLRGATVPTTMKFERLASGMRYFVPLPSRACRSDDQHIAGCPDLQRLSRAQRTL